MSDKTSTDIMIQPPEQPWQYIEPTLTTDYILAYTQMIHAIMMSFGVPKEVLMDQYYCGYDAGLDGEQRNWKRSCSWHRGYLRGRFQRYKNTGRMYI